MYVLRVFFFFFFFFGGGGGGGGVVVAVVCFFLLQNAPIAMIFDDAIYLFIYLFFCILFQCYCVQVPS